jgi:hypothetical protein
MIYFIRYLLESYGADADIKNLVDSRYIAIIPVLNPDGLAVAGRLNDAGVDLNRNFSTTWIPESDEHFVDNPFSEPELQAMRDFSLQENFHISLTFHSGAVLVNIPFDYASESGDGIVPAENYLVREFGYAYSRAGIFPNRFMDNPDIYQSQYMEDGIINGGDWYVITGSLQDWSYLETGCLDLTVEVARRSPSTEEGAEQVFAYNKDAIIAYIKKGGQGVYGIVTDAAMNPLSDAVITLTHVNGSPSAGDIIVNTDADGYYRRIFLPGNYTLSFEKSGFISESVNVIIPESYSGLEENIALVTE